MSGNVQEMSPTYRFSHQLTPTFPVLRKCAWHTKFPVCGKCAWNVTYPAFKSFHLYQKVPIGNVKEICLKCHVSWFRKFAWNSALYCTRKSQGNVKISWCSRKIHISCTFNFLHCRKLNVQEIWIFLDISLPRKFRISSMPPVFDSYA